MATTRIEWADRVWNPVTGCSKCSDACDNCYAERMSKRLAGRCGYPTLDPFKVTWHQDRLFEPISWNKPSRVFVCSMADLFHSDVRDDKLLCIFTVIALSPKQTFLLLTKRPERAHEFLCLENLQDSIIEVAGSRFGVDGANRVRAAFKDGNALPNVWLGATIWDQASADRSVPILLSTPAAKRFVSIEPMLGPVDLRDGLGLMCAPGDIDWVICGGETGPGARPMHPDWPRSLRDQCQAAQVPFFFKQWGEFGPSELRTSQGATDHTNGRYHPIADPTCKGLVVRLGTRKAGRVLDGRTWEEVPA